MLCCVCQRVRVQYGYLFRQLSTGIPTTLITRSSGSSSPKRLELTLTSDQTLTVNPRLALLASQTPCQTGHGPTKLRSISDVALVFYSPCSVLNKIVILLFQKQIRYVSYISVLPQYRIYQGNFSESVVRNSSKGSDDAWRARGWRGGKCGMDLVECSRQRKQIENLNVWICDCEGIVSRLPQVQEAWRSVSCTCGN